MFISEKTVKSNTGISSISQEEANQQAQIMDDRNCTYCTNCTNCTNCINCIDCRNCINCRNCTNCIDCNNCTYCRSCTYCTYCTNCKNCRNCTYCTNCTDCIDCIDCRNCINCRNCIDCRNCTTGQSLGILNDWFSFTYLKQDKQYVKIGYKEKTISEAKEYWSNKEKKQEILAGVLFAETLGKLRGWNQE